MAEILPAVFIGHGNPMNALQQNAYTEAWRRMGEETTRPRANGDGGSISMLAVRVGHPRR